MRMVGRWSSFAAVMFVLIACAPGGTAPVVTDLYVDPVAGSDAGSGSAAAPLRTLSAALALADDGVTIHLAVGTYGAANGESWPAQVGFPPVAAPNVPAGVVIEGAAGVRLVGPGGATTAAALVFAGDARVSDVEVEGFERAILAWLPGEVVLTRVRATGNAIDGLLAFGDAEVLAIDSRFDANGLSGAAAFGLAALYLDGGMADNNRTGVFAADFATVSVLDTQIALNGTTSDAAHSGVFARDDARVDLSGVLVEWNSFAGVEVRGDASVALTDGTVYGGEFGLLVIDAGSDASLRVYDSDVSSNGTGIRWASNATGGELYVRGTTVQFNSSHGVAVTGDPGVVDLGVQGEASGNRFDQNGTHQLEDNRDDRFTADGIVITVDIDAILPAGCSMGAVVYSGPYTYTCNGVTAFNVEGLNQRLQVVTP